MKDWDEETKTSIGRWLHIHGDSLRTMQKIHTPGTIMNDMVNKGNTYAVSNMVSRIKAQLRDAAQVIDEACDMIPMDEIWTEVFA